MTSTLTIERSVHFGIAGRGRHKELRAGAAPPPPPAGRVPRVARLLALAHRIDGLVRSGAVADFAEAARLGHVTRARMSQIMSLVNLAPDVQEAILFLPSTTQGRDPIILRDLLPIALTPDWRKQRRQWTQFARASGVALASPKLPT